MHGKHKFNVCAHNHNKTRCTPRHKSALHHYRLSGGKHIRLSIRKESEPDHCEWFLLVSVEVAVARNTEQTNNPVGTPLGGLQNDAKVA